MFLILFSSSSLIDLSKQIQNFSKTFEENRSDDEIQSFILEQFQKCDFESLPSHRLAFVASDLDCLKTQLNQLNTMNSSLDASPHYKLVKKFRDQLCFAFSGMGTEFWRFERSALESENSLVSNEAFAKALETCESHFQFKIIPNNDIDESNAKSLPCEIVQPTIFAYQFAMSQLWKEFGVDCNVVMSSSVGDVSGARESKRYDFETSTELSKAQGRCHSLARGLGAMLVIIGVDLEEIEKICNEVGCEIGADIGVKLQALTGTFEQLKAVRNILELRDNVTLIDPGASVPFHSKIFRQFESTIKQQFALFKLDTSDTIKKRWFSSIVGREVNATELNEDFWFELFVGPARSKPMFHEIVKFVDVYIEMNSKPLYARTFKDVCKLIERNEDDFLSFSTIDYTQEMSELHQLIEQVAKMFLFGVIEERVDYVKAIKQSFEISAGKK